MTENDSGTMELTRRKALGSMAIVGAAGAGAGAGSWAWFSDEESVDDNTISAGQLQLGDVVGDSFEHSNVYPGWGPETDSFEVSEAEGNIDNAQLDIDIDVSDDDDGELSQELEATVTYDGDDDEPLSDGSLSNADGTHTVDPPGTEGADLTFEVEWPEPSNDVDSNHLENEGVTIDVTFYLRQSGADQYDGS